MSDARWYVLYSLSGQEKKVAQSILEKAKALGVDHLIEEVLVPTEGVVEVKRGKKVNAEKKIFPGYVLAKMVMNDDTWHMIRNIPKVTNFLGANNKPQPISEREVKKIFEHIEQAALAPKFSDNYEVGNSVRIIDGPFESFVGVVEEVDAVKSRLKVAVSIFGRATVIDLDFGQVSKS
ncbi:MAG: transcription termination/antitermination protein NusG [Alphaproteobacteria bacterium]|nr:transcription termination/antitermination protein NusG [Alphaproteobacteria bacterium]OJV15372.1 MAG: transcription termination/antitermination factor NusG [Alphaproteobacteria bacterium 33-17]